MTADEMRNRAKALVKKWPPMSKAQKAKVAALIRGGRNA